MLSVFSEETRGTKGRRCLRTVMFSRGPRAKIVSKSAMVLSLLAGLAALPLHGQTVANFVRVAPCRVVDTRDAGFSAGFGQPFMPARSVRTFAVPSSACGIPSSALAYSFNITVVPHGSMPYLTIWPAGQAQPVVSTLNSYSGAVIANAAIVPAGTNGAV